MSTPRPRWAGLTLVPVLLLAGLAAAEEDAPPPPKQGDALLPVTEIRRIGLLEAAQMGLEANLVLASGAYGPPIAMEQYRAARAIFDPLVSASLDLAHDETPATSSFFGVNVFSSDTFGGTAGVTKLLPSGGTVSLLYQADRLDSNNLLNNLVPYWTNGAVLQGTQPLLRGAGDVVMTDIRLASNGVRIANESQRALVQDVLLRVVTAYWELVYSQEEVLSRRKSEDLAQQLLRDAKARLEAKVGTPIDVAEAEAGVQRRRGNRIVAERLRGGVRDQLRALILPFTEKQAAGVTFEATDSVEGVLHTMPTADELQRYIDLAIANRPELKAAKANLSNRDIEVYSAANAVKPQVDLVGRIGSGGLDGGFGRSLGDMFGGEAVSAGIGVQFSMFIGQKAARANLRLAEWARRQTFLNNKELENQVVAEVRAGVRDVLTAQAVEQAGAAEVEAAQEQLRGEQRRLEAGKSTPFLVLQREDDLSGARTRYLRARADRRIAEAAFWRAVGFLADTLGVGGKSGGTDAGAPCPPPK